MSKSDITINARYHYHSRIKGDVEVQLFNDFYLQVTADHKGKRQQYKFEVATLDPKAGRHEESATPWLVPAIITAFVAIFFLYSRFTAIEYGYSLIGALISAGMSAFFFVLFYYSSERKWVIEGRYSRYPLVELPYRKRQREEANAFVEHIQKAIANDKQKKRYSDDDLFAGELRMLRRLSQKGVINRLHYDQAKRYMMISHGGSQQPLTLTVTQGN